MAILRGKSYIAIFVVYIDFYVLGITWALLKSKKINVFVFLFFGLY